MPVIESPAEPQKKKDRVPFWRENIRLAEKQQEDRGLKFNKTTGELSGAWGEYVKFFEGDQWMPGMGGRYKAWNRITANIAKSNIDSIRPQLYFHNPKVQITLKNPDIADQPVLGPPDPMTGQPVVLIAPGTPVATIGGQPVDARKQEKLFEAIDDYYLDECNVKLKTRRIINDALILPYGVSKWEWVVEMGMEEETDAQGLPTGNQVEKVVKQYPRYSRVQPWCFLWDPELEEFDMEQAAWYAEVAYLSKEEIESIPNVQMTPTDWAEIGKGKVYLPQGYESEASLQEKKDQWNRYKVYHIHDLAGGNYYMWIDGSRKMARVEEPSYYSIIEGGPYTVLGFDETPGGSCPIPLLSNIKSKALAYNRIRSYQVNHVGRYNRKYSVVEGTISDEEMEKLETGADGDIVKVKTQEGRPEPINDAQIVPDVYNVANILKSEITEDVGVTSYGRGTREPGVDTAFEANAIQSGADIKVQEKRDVVREYMRRVLRKLNQMLQAYADQPLVQKVVGKEGDSWIKWTKEDIQGEFVLDVDIYSSMPFSEEVEKKQVLEAVSILAQFPETNRMKLLQRVEKVFKWDESVLYSEAELQQQAQQQQQMMAQQQANQDQANKAQSGQLRPSEGQVQRMPDMMAGIMGPARRGT